MVRVGAPGITALKFHIMSDWILSDMKDWILSDWIQLANLVVQCAILAALFWYARKILRIRRASQDQAEALQRPCITLATAARPHEEYEDAMLNMDSALGGLTLATQERNVALQNIGSGPALNVRYEFHPSDPERGADLARRGSYLPNIPPRGSFVTPAARDAFRDLECEFVATYESLSGQAYESRITIHNLVLTKSAFRIQQGPARTRQTPARARQEETEDRGSPAVAVSGSSVTAPSILAAWPESPAGGSRRRSFTPWRSLVRWLQAPVRR